VNLLNPIHTEKRQCQDCYKCVRNCPVKAIKVEGNCATVIIESCILCGNCVAVCPNQAKKIRDDVPLARRLLTVHPRVLVSLAPSFIAAFPRVRPAQIIAAIRRLGFFGVSETALGAQQVSAHVAASMRETPGQLLISSACPTVVSYLQRHQPQIARHLIPLLSPLLAHCRMLRTHYGPDSAIVFFGPCIAKKAEADAHPELLDVALTFQDLQRWFDQEQIDPASMSETADDHFIPESATDGALYPVDGGMIAGIKNGCSVSDAQFMSFSGLSSIEKALVGMDESAAHRNLMIEALACEGGCVNGPAMNLQAPTITKRHQVLHYGDHPAAAPRQPTLPIVADLRTAPLSTPQYSETQMRETLHAVGKFTADDERNCGGCGYDSCREFARAMLGHKAERSMCVTYMRQLAHKKADALIQKMPSAVVIVNQNLQLVECNASFARLFVKPAPATAPPAPLEGTDLAKLVPFHRLFRSVLTSGEDIVDRDLRYRDTILHLSIFTIEKNVLVGAIIQDITKPAVQKEQVIRRAQEVIQRNLSTVQKIAYLLGENAADAEITLNSIIESFSPPRFEEKPEDPAKPDAGHRPGRTDPPDQGDADDWRKRYRR